MTISNISLPSSNSAGPITSNAVANAKPDTRTTNDTPPSTIVTLSAQAQKLSQSQNSQPTGSSSQTNNPVSQNTASVPKEANEASGIQFIEGDNRGGRISTYA